jgi:AsmA protein
MAWHVRRLIIWTTAVLLSLALLAMLGIALLVWGIDPDVFRGRIERAATESLGRRVQLTGALRWRPGLNLQIESLGGRIDNAEGFEPSPLASWRALRMGVALRPLLDQHLVVDRVDIDGLRLSLARSARGVNWDLPASNPRKSEPGMTLAIGSVRLREAAVSFADEARGIAWSVTELALDVNLPAKLDAPTLRFSGLSLQARLNGAPLESSGIALQLKLPRLDFDRARSHIAAPEWQMKWNDADISGAMNATAGEKPAAEGSLSVHAPSLRRLLQSVSVSAPNMRDAAALGPVDLGLRFAVSGNTADLWELDVRLDATRLTGQVKLPTVSPMSLRFDLAADEVDMDRYLTPVDEPGTPLELPLPALAALDAKGVLTIRRATLEGAAARQMRIDVD